ncbi:unnamed protein product [Adineta ricciae]|uniref:Uncharacterized protein n=1 Tax=Adineta ricciae TaxID=249248 RepID=A0A815QNR0_ADIRI|nr:unnamed protein product [Adineta ricciae]CAF1646070.1 unnamed protein product [Adineta ricciae]
MRTNLFISSTGAHAVMRWIPGASSDVLIAGISGTSGFNATLVNNPASVKVDTFMKFYVADCNNGRIQMLCSNNSPGENDHIGSCRTGIKSFVSRTIGFDRLLLSGFRSNLIFFFDIRPSDTLSSDKIHTFRTGRILSQDSTSSDRTQPYPMPGKEQNSLFHMIPRSIIIPSNCCHRNRSDIYGFPLSIFVFSCIMVPTDIGHCYMSEMSRNRLITISMMAVISLIENTMPDSSV